VCTEEHLSETQEQEAHPEELEAQSGLAVIAAIEDFSSRVMRNTLHD
jgi:hypothetical protein